MNKNFYNFSKTKKLYNYEVSFEICVLSGVSQGSHLGPLLFLLLDNSLPRTIKNAQILMFADDVKIFSLFKSPSTLLQDDLNALNNWCQINCLKLNLHKLIRESKVKLLPIILMITL